MPHDLNFSGSKTVLQIFQCNYLEKLKNKRGESQEMFESDQRDERLRNRKCSLNWLEHKYQTKIWVYQVLRLQLELRLDFKMMLKLQHRHELLISEEENVNRLRTETKVNLDPKIPLTFQVHKLEIFRELNK